MSELVLDNEQEFFAPVSTDAIDSMIGQYNFMRGKIERMSAIVTGDEYAGALRYFASGNQIEGRHASVGNMFDLPGAIASLNADFWQKAMDMTDVYSAMPEPRRQEWRKQIREMTAPDFEESTVRSTLLDLMMSRQKFFAERVDGIFRALSGEHVTNAPEAFGKRMILAGISNGYYGTERAGYINDLRCVIAKFMGRDDPAWNATAPIIEAARARHGEWVTVDGGAFRIRCYLKGTAHIEVHPDMAWRLNSVLAGLYPTAIPAKFRQKPAKKTKEFEMIQRPLPFAVIAWLERLENAVLLEKTDDWRNPYKRTPLPNALQFKSTYATKPGGRDEAEKVLAMLGGVLTKDGHWQFDYPAYPAIREIICSGCIPDQKAHQFYPTPDSVAEMAIEMAEIGPDDICLEPSAGQGGLADFMPKDRTRCVEISKLHCDILTAKGFTMVLCDDFLEWATLAGQNPFYDRVVMNPPFSEGRAKAHLEAAASLVKQGGRIVAVLPASMRNKTELTGFDVDWSRVIENEFAGTSVSVAILRGVRE